MIIGGGRAGLAAAALGAQVALVERGRLRGTNLNVGTVPSKAIIQSSRVFAEMRDSVQYGVPAPADVELDSAGIMKRMRRVRARVSLDASAAQLSPPGWTWEGPDRHRIATARTCDSGASRRDLPDQKTAATTAGIGLRTR